MNREDPLNSLRAAVESDSVKTDPDFLSAYTVDGVTPWAVVFPESTEQVSDLVRVAHKKKLAVVPWGGGSKIDMGNPPSRLDLIIATSRLNRITDMDGANLTITAQAGVRFRDLQDALAGVDNRCYLPHEDAAEVSTEAVCSDRKNAGCFVPVWPAHADSATLGGIVAANSSGPTRLLYGLPRDMVLGVRYVAPNGNIIGMGGKTVKNVSGYDMCKLMIGSMGTLGVLCDITLKLLPMPERSKTLVFTFTGLDPASRFVDGIFGTQLLPAAVEILNAHAWNLLAMEEMARLEAGRYGVAVALEGFEEAVGRMESEIRGMAEDSNGELGVSVEEAGHAAFWNHYINLPGRLPDLHPGVASIRVNYPISCYREGMGRVETWAQDHRLDLALLAHAGSGVLGIHCFGGPAPTKPTDGIVDIVERLLAWCRRVAGNLVIERAEAAVKQRVPVWGLPKEDLLVMKRIKEQMDPLGLFSPGRFVGGI